MMTMEEMILSSLNLLILIMLYTLSKTHVMNNLIIMEFIVISISLFMFKLSKMLMMENYLILYFIILMIVESVLGISLLISMIRTHSNDYMKSIMIMKL